MTRRQKRTKPSPLPLASTSLPGQCASDVIQFMRAPAPSRPCSRSPSPSAAAGAATCAAWRVYTGCFFVACHRDSAPSAPPETNQPSLIAATTSVATSVAGARKMSWLCSPTFHKRTVRSAPDVHTRSRESATMAVTPDWWPKSVSVYARSPASHTLTQRSAEPEKSARVPRRKASAVTASRWPMRLSTLTPGGGRALASPPPAAACSVRGTPRPRVSARACAWSGAAGAVERHGGDHCG